MLYTFTIVNAFTAEGKMNQFVNTQNQYWKTIIDTMAEALMVVDPKGLIISVNQSMVRLTGFKEHELVGEPCGVLCCDRCFVKKEQSTDHFCALFEKKHLKLFKKKPVKPLMCLKMPRF